MKVALHCVYEKTSDPKIKGQLLAIFILKSEAESFITQREYAEHYSTLGKYEVAYEEVECDFLPVSTMLLPTTLHLSAAK